MLFSGDARLVNAKTLMGEITILNNHETCIGVLAVGRLSVIDSQGQQHFFAVQSGFVQVREGNEVRCLVN